MRRERRAFLKQAFVRLKSGAHSVGLGRIEFIELTEVASSHATLAAVKRDRLAHRLIGSRFPGNPAMVERLHDEVLREIEGVEMQLRRLLDQQGSSVRTGADRPVPPGYANAVAEYFRKLSKQ